MILDGDAGEAGRPAAEMQLQRWHNPPEGVWKINVDGAFWPSGNTGERVNGLGVRDDQGHAALVAETHASIAALQAAADHGLQNIVLETDSLTLVKALESDAYDRVVRARGGMLFREAKYIMD